MGQKKPIIAVQKLNSDYTVTVASPVTFLTVTAPKSGYYRLKATVNIHNVTGNANYNTTLQWLVGTVNLKPYWFEDQSTSAPTLGVILTLEEPPIYIAKGTTVSLQVGCSAGQPVIYGTYNTKIWIEYV